MGLESPGTRSTHPEQEKTRLWQELLSKTLPLDDDRLELLPDILADFCQTLGLLTGEKLGQYLRNPEAELSVIDDIKQYAKDLSRGSQSDDEHMIANTLYYAAIAHALLCHDAKITRYSYAELANAFGRLSKIGWIEKHFAQLFARACKYCQKKH